MWSQLFGALGCALLLLLACGSPPPGKGDGATSSTADGAASFRVETVVSNLEVPWSIVFAPDGRMLFTERPGRVRVFERGQLRAEPLAAIPAATRLRFGPDGKLYVTTGDAAQKENGQKLDTLSGKTLRLNDDGTVPSDNPFIGRPRV